MASTSNATLPSTYWKDMMEEDDVAGESQIQKIFVGATVLVTGGTGFLGKLLIEKLLRSCPGIKMIYMLTRPKKSKDVTQRKQEQFNDLVYGKLKKQQPNFVDKVAVLEGDVSKLGLGVSEADRRTIVNEVDFIFHCAATVRFNEPLKVAVAINVRGTREIMLLAKDCVHLKSLVHVSTAYSNAPHDEIEEKFYDVINLSGDKLIELADSLDSETLDNITPGLIGKYPNTYTYTKAAAENIVLQYASGLPVAIVRPSIVVATSNEPLEGWVNNIYGPGGVAVASAVGLMHVMRCDGSLVVDLVPGDLVISTCIGVAWRVARGSNDATTQPRIYMAGTSPRTPITWREYQDICEFNENETPSIQAVYRFFLYLIPSKFWFQVASLFLHWIPAYIMDGILFLTGKKPKLVNIYQKMHEFEDMLDYFTTRQWKFHNENTVSLYEELSKVDQENFNFDYESLDWEEYLRAYVRGVRAYLLKESPESIPEAVKRQHKLRMLHLLLCTLVALFCGLTIWMFYKFVF